VSRKKIDLRRYVPVLIVAVALIGLIYVVVDWRQIRDALKQANLRPIPFALATTLLSYTCISLSFAMVSRLLGVDMPYRDLSLIGFISIVFNHLVASGGAAGYSLRFMLMDRHGVSMREVVTISILHFLVTSSIMIAMLPIAVLYLVLNASLGRTTAILLGVFALLLILASMLAIGLIFWAKMRKKVVGALVKAIDTLLHRDVKEPMERFEATVALGIQAMREHPFYMVLVLILTVADWLFSLTALWFCFRAFEITLSPGQAISGFVIGTLAGVASLFPGGLGIQEASMAGVLALFGIPLEKAVLASVLYRLVYSIVPYLVSLGFYRQILRRERKESSPKPQEVKSANPDA
jgi:uncharacterized protein (TIRG00374 family)